MTEGVAGRAGAGGAGVRVGWGLGGGMGGTFFFSPLGNNGTGERPGWSGFGASRALLEVGSRVLGIIATVLIGYSLLGCLRLGGYGRASSCTLTSLRVIPPCRLISLVASYVCFAFQRRV